MSTSAVPNSATLSVTTADDAAEIYVVNGRFDLVSRGLGNFTATLPPGIYKVRVRTGFDTSEKHVVLEPGGSVQLRFDRLTFSSPVPLNETARTHEYHQAAAEAGSTDVDAKVGVGSSIFVFARDWSPSDASPSTLNPAQDLSLCTMTGEVLVNLAEQGKHSAEQNLDPYAACNIEVNPGNYCLMLTLPSGVRIAQTVVACSSWQTQVFLLQRVYDESSGVRRADVGNASVMMARIPDGFKPENPQSRLTEIARLGLANRRKVLADDVSQMALAKSDNPMLGIYAAHLMLLADKSDPAMLITVVNNLRRLVGEPHPDVEAVALGAGLPTGYIFQAPPMLRRSWLLLLRATVERPELVPRDSLCARISDVLWGGEPWLHWRDDKTARERALEQIQGTLRSMLNPQSVLAAKSEESTGDSPFQFVNEMRKQQPTARSNMRYHTMPKAVVGASSDEVNAEAAPLPPPPPEVETDVNIVPSRPPLDAFVERLGVPRSRVEELLQDEGISAADLGEK